MGLRLTAIVFIAIGGLGIETEARAGYINYGGTGSSGFTVFNNPSKWNPGPNTAQFGGFGNPGGATWSIMPVNTLPGVGDFHGGSFSLDVNPILAQIPGGMNAVINTWAAVSGYTNLGQVADSGGQPGSGAGLPGDIRIGAYPFDGPSKVLAHAYQPATAAMFSNGTIGGDVHFDAAENWGNATGIDAFTVALHEIGHSLGLGHSNDSNAVMFPFYSGIHRNLGADDIAGIQFIYGRNQNAPAVPEPASLAIWAGIGAFGLLVARRRRSHRI